MSQPRRTGRNAKRVQPTRWRRLRFSLGLGLAAIAILCLVWFARGGLAWCARRAAVRELDRGAISRAQSWLLWSAWLDPSDGRTDLIQAACYRHAQEADRYASAFESARRKGAPAEGLQQEYKLGLIHAGGIGENDSGQIAALIEAGLPPNEVASAFVFGFLSRNELAEAKKVLDAWTADRPKDAEVAYITGIYWETASEPARAEAGFKLALARQPRHELARMSLAELLERQDRLGEAFREYAEWAARSPVSDRACTGAARILRKMGRLDQARAVLEARTSPSDSAIAATEMAQIELESGDFQQARQRFQNSRWDEAEDRLIRTSAATAIALGGDAAGADWIFSQADAAYQRLRRTGDLRVRLAINPSDSQAAGALARLSAGPSAVADGKSLLAAEAVESGQSKAATGPDLYAIHCRACHGTDGRGDGHAARHVFPRPRNLRIDKFRLVSTENGSVTLADEEALIRRGMPGTSMQSLKDLTERQVTLLAEEVVRLRREGVREQVVRDLEEAGEKIDQDEVGQIVEQGTAPGRPIRLPPIGLLEAAAVARGKNDYLKLGCNKCHGDGGSGPSETRLFDESGFPTAPRDLVGDPLKGGREPESIYLRIVAGMPGTPHPGCLNVPEGQLVDLVQHCRSLFRDPERKLTNHERLVQAASANLAPSAGPKGP